ncbi:MAG: hypothetical protein AB7F76_07865 [Parvibaculaceae bacterium]
MELSTVLSRRGRPPKAVSGAADTTLSQIARPPADLVELVAKVEVVFRGFTAAQKMRDDARSEEGNSTLGDRLVAAIAARNRAYAQRDVAESLGEQSDAPTAETIKALEAAVYAAQAEFDRWSPAPRLAALDDELERRRKLLGEAVAAADHRYQAWAGEIAVAADEQISDAVLRIAEAYAITNQVQWAMPSVGRLLSLPRLSSGGRHSTPDAVEVAAATRSISSTMYAARLAAAPDVTRAAETPDVAAAIDPPDSPLGAIQPHVDRRTEL